MQEHNQYLINTQLLELQSAQELEQEVWVE